MVSQDDRPSHTSGRGREVSTRSAGAIPVTRFHDHQGLPTCCILWGSKPDTCPLLRTTKWGLQETCNWTDRPLYRRGTDGFLIPDDDCPIHPQLPNAPD